MPSPDERREAAIARIAKSLYDCFGHGEEAGGFIQREWEAEAEAVYVAAYDAALGGEADRSEQWLVTRVRSVLEGSRVGPYAISTNNAERLAREIAAALSEHPEPAKRTDFARASDDFPNPAEHPEQSVEPGEKESNTTTSVEHPGPPSAGLNKTPGNSAEHPETGEREDDGEPSETREAQFNAIIKLQGQLAVAKAALGFIEDEIGGRAGQIARAQLNALDAEHANDSHPPEPLQDGGERERHEVRQGADSTGYGYAADTILQEHAALTSSPDTPTQVGSEDAGAKGTGQELDLPDEVRHRRAGAQSGNLAIP